jgi:DNA repair protein RadC
MPKKKYSEVYKNLISMAKDYVAEEKVLASEPKVVAEFILPMVLHEKQEKMFVLYVDIKHNIIDFDIVTTGLVDRSLCHAREVFRNAIVKSASRIILAHNHPSGSTLPSTQDIECTHNLVKAGKIIGIDVLDHVIVSSDRTSRDKLFTSLREYGVLEPANN